MSYNQACFMTTNLLGFVQEINIDKYSLTMIVTLSIIATILSFLKYIIGLKRVKFFTPIMFVIALFDLSIINNSLEPLTGLKYGLPILFMAVVGVLIGYLVMEKTVMHFVAKLSLIFSLSILFVPAVYYIATWQGSTGFLATNIVSILLLVMVINFFTVSLIRRGLFSGLKTIAENIIVSLALFYILTLSAVSEFIYRHPEIVFVMIILNIFIGKYTGLRLFELIRFSRLLTEENPEEKPKK